MRPFRLAPAQPARQLVTRPRLLALLGERFERRLVLVVAGAGFGKSTLLAQAVAENELDPRGVDVWLSCAPDDAAASQLAAGLLTALHADPAGAADPVAAITAAVWQRAPAEVALLLDDVHLLLPGSPGAALLAELVRTLPANAHLVLVGRGDPPVGWSRLAAAGEVREIREDELGFAAQELAQFARLREVPPSLLTGVGGWPALAELTAVTGQSRVADFGGRRSCRGCRGRTAGCWRLSPPRAGPTTRWRAPSPAVRWRCGPCSPAYR